MNNKIKEFRQAQGLSQEELSIKSGVSRPTISMIETNTLDNIESKTMLKLAKALNCDIGDIFFKENVVFTQQKENQEG
jgi:DNA-binding XRE family transcriptional regulator|nr:MAG TPA: Helix-turn-helix XRE-family like protein [Caudoviricetes sp.]